MSTRWYKTFGNILLHVSQWLTAYCMASWCCILFLSPSITDHRVREVNYSLPTASPFQTRIILLAKTTSRIHTTSAAQRLAFKHCQTYKDVKNVIFHPIFYPIPIQYIKPISTQSKAIYHWKYFGKIFSNSFTCRKFGVSFPWCFKVLDPGTSG